MNNKVSNIKKLFYIYIGIGMILFLSIITFYYYILNKSSIMLENRTYILKQISDIKFNLAETHLWFMEYKLGDEYDIKKYDTSEPLADYKKQPVI